MRHLIERFPDLVFSVSATTRAQRPGEADGREYHFLGAAEFEARVGAGEFLEHADVFGNLYGTHAGDTARCLETGNDVVLVIDVQGARQVRGSDFPHVGIFVLPPSFEVLEERLRRRSKDSEAQMVRRLAVAQREVDAVVEYDYVVVNDEVDAAVARLQAIIEAERARLPRMRDEVDGIVRNFRLAARHRVG